MRVAETMFTYYNEFTCICIIIDWVQLLSRSGSFMVIVVIKFLVVTFIKYLENFWLDIHFIFIAIFRKHLAKFSCLLDKIKAIGMQGEEFKGGGMQILSLFRNLKLKLRSRY